MKTVSCILPCLLAAAPNFPAQQTIAGNASGKRKAFNAHLIRSCRPHL